MATLLRQDGRDKERRSDLHGKWAVIAAKMGKPWTPDTPKMLQQILKKTFLHRPLFTKRIALGIEHNILTQPSIQYRPVMAMDRWRVMAFGEERPLKRG